MGHAVIELTNLTKYYGSIRGIEDITLQIQKGEIHGFLGPNGAGKTTTIRILVGLLKATSGEARVLGHPAGSLEILEHIGYLPSDFELYRHFTVSEFLDFVEQVRGHAPLRDELVTRLDVEEEKRISSLSRGNKQKVGIVQALMHDPEVIIADEPTTGLDPLMQQEVQKILKEFHKRGKTIFFSSHILSEVQAVCETVTIIKEGHVISSGTISDLLERIPRKIIVDFLEPLPMKEVTTLVKNRSYSLENTKLTLYVQGRTPEVLAEVIQLPRVKDITVPKPTLEEYFLPIYEREGHPEYPE